MRNRLLTLLATPVVVVLTGGVAVATATSRPPG